MARDPFASSLFRLRTADRTFQQWLAGWNPVSGGPGPVNRPRPAWTLPGDTRHKAPWQLAEAVGDAMPCGFQHLPGRAVPQVTGMVRTVGLRSETPGDTRKCSLWQFRNADTQCHRIDGEAGLHWHSTR